MNYSNELSLKEAIKELLNDYKLNNKLNEVRLINSWEKVVGKLISKHTNKLYIRRKVLFIELDSAALKNELSYAKQKIINALNKEVNEDVIEEIVFR
ncbi:MAG: DUF721 domain-containing protein [Bacteroidales bacterium]|nr:DUF721 domain-containing protein [Bacteroidales bacterium]